MLPNIRAWDKEYSLMTYSNKEYLDDSVNYRFGHFYVAADYEVYFMTGSGVFDDKYGKEIYEQDIVEIIVFGIQKTIEGKVVFRGGTFCVQVYVKEFCYYMPLFEIVDKNTDYFIAILGNVYENPELKEVYND